MLSPNKLLFYNYTKSPAPFQQKNRGKTTVFQLIHIFIYPIFQIPKLGGFMPAAGTLS